jgi:hypothetical protein
MPPWQPLCSMPYSIAGPWAYVKREDPDRVHDPIPPGAAGAVDGASRERAGRRSVRPRADLRRAGVPARLPVVRLHTTWMTLVRPRDQRARPPALRRPQELPPYANRTGLLLQSTSRTRPPNSLARSESRRQAVRESGALAARRGKTEYPTPPRNPPREESPARNWTANLSFFPFFLGHRPNPRRDRDLNHRMLMGFLLTHTWRSFTI